MKRPQLELFDAGIRHHVCLRCRRTLHTDRKRLYRTRVAGLCFVCLAAFERWPGWSLERFIVETKETRDGKQKEN